MNVLIAIDKQDKVLTQIGQSLESFLDKGLFTSFIEVVPTTKEINLFMTNRWDNMGIEFILRLRTSSVTSDRVTHQKLVSSNTQTPFGFRLLHTANTLLQKEGWGEFGFNPCTEFNGLPGWIDFIDIEVANVADKKDLSALGDGKVFASSVAKWMNKAAKYLQTR